MSTDSDLKVVAAKTPAARAAAEPTSPLPLVVPYEAPAIERFRGAMRARFRLPTEDDAPPPNVRLLGMSFWAAACVFAGLIPAGRLIISVAFGETPGWYAPLTISIALLGITAMAASFGAIHRANLPWYLLCVATLLLGANLALVYLVL